MERKKKNSWLFDRAATIAIVIAMIVSLISLTPGTEVNTIKVHATEGETTETSYQTTGSAFKVATGSALDFVAAPGKTTGVRIFTNGFDKSLSEGIYQFVSFELETSDKNIIASDLSMSGSGLYNHNNTGGGPNDVYPSNDSGNADNYPEYDINENGNIIIDFNVSCTDLLSTGNHTITLYGITFFNEYNNFAKGRKDKLRSYKVPLATFTLKNTVSPKEAKLYIDSITYNKEKLIPSSNSVFSVKIKNTGAADASEVYIVSEMGGKLTPDYEMQRLRVGSLKAGESQIYKVPFTVNSNAEKGNDTVSFTVSGIDKYGNPIDSVSESIYITVLSGSGSTPVDAPSLTISTKQNYKLLQPGTDDSVVVKISNNGTKKAKNVRLICESGLGVADGLTKNYTTNYIEVEDIEAGKSVSVEVPFNVNGNFSKGIHELSFSLSYDDAQKHPYKSENMTMYVQHYKTADGMADETSRAYLQISGVSQVPSNPTAGAKVSVSFNITNKGNARVNNLHLYGSGLSSTGFLPVSGEPYQEAGSLDEGESKKITMTFMAGEDIPQGVNPLTIGYEYFDNSYAIQSGSTTIYVLNVINHKFDDIDVGRPKIIVSNYSTVPDILKAGETFDFSYTLKNTHTGKEARNIKITLSQIEGVLAPAQGTNIFYLDKLDPTQEVTLSLPLKSRADTVTGDYPIVLKLEYEYDDMSEVDKEHGGVSEENTIKVRVIENYRPVIENIFIDSYQGIMVGQPVDLSFEFYNMGKSTLGNVYITIEGDFELANNSAMSYVGAVQGYGQEYLAPQIVPLVGGEAHGTVTIHFEDSNGDEQTKSSEFTAWVDDPMGGGMEGDYGMGFNPISGPYYGGGWGELPDEFGEFGEFGEGFPGMEGEEEGFFASIPWWGWVIAGVVLVGIVVVIIIVVKKHKKKKDTDEEDNEDI
ncbi:MAG: hypothetical protein K6E95_01880 [Lachnospiraceae bacterium]|nr:hypothetical protein [Lachnospiraceae bacterium]